MIKITGKQCKGARSLLKWNVHDLVSRVKVMNVGRIHDFERGIVRLVHWESEELMHIFKKAGIEFRSDQNVALTRTSADDIHAWDKIPEPLPGDAPAAALPAEVSPPALPDDSVKPPPAQGPVLDIAQAEKAPVSPIPPEDETLDKDKEGEKTDEPI